jgi:co-chaperonin GroES (HSP10)
VKVDGQELLIMNEADVLGVIKTAKAVKKAA